MWGGGGAQCEDTGLSVTKSGGNFHSDVRQFA